MSGGNGKTVASIDEKIARRCCSVKEAKLSYT